MHQTREFHVFARRRMVSTVLKGPKSRTGWRKREERIHGGCAERDNMLDPWRETYEMYLLGPHNSIGIHDNTMRGLETGFGHGRKERALLHF